MFIAFVIIAVIVLFGIAIATSSETEEARKNDYAGQTNFLTENKIAISAEYFYKNTLNTVNIRYIVDNHAKKIYISNTSSTFEEIPFSELTGCEIMTDSMVTGGVGRAIVGGVIGGDAGAIVGATTAKTHIQSYKIVIYRANIGRPQMELILINSNTKTTDPNYTKAVSFAGMVNASIKAIISLQAQAANRVVVPEEPLKKVVLTPNEANKIITIQYVRELKNLGLADAKEFVEQNEPVVYDMVEASFAYSLVDTLAKRGISAQVRDCEKQ